MYPELDGLIPGWMQWSQPFAVGACWFAAGFVLNLLVRLVIPPPRFTLSPDEVFPARVAAPFRGAEQPASTPAWADFGQRAGTFQAFAFLVEGLAVFSSLAFVLRCAMSVSPLPMWAAATIAWAAWHFGRFAALVGTATEPRVVGVPEPSPPARLAVAASNALVAPLAFFALGWWMPTAPWLAVALRVLAAACAMWLLGGGGIWAAARLGAFPNAPADVVAQVESALGGEPSKVQVVVTPLAATEAFRYHRDHRLVEVAASIAYGMPPDERAPLADARLAPGGLSQSFAEPIRRWQVRAALLTAGGSGAFFATMPGIEAALPVCLCIAGFVAWVVAVDLVREARRRRFEALLPDDDATRGRAVLRALAYGGEGLALDEGEASTVEQLRARKLLLPFPRPPQPMAMRVAEWVFTAGLVAVIAIWKVTVTFDGGAVDRALQAIGGVNGSMVSRIVAAQETAGRIDAAIRAQRVVARASSDSAARQRLAGLLLRAGRCAEAAQVGGLRYGPLRDRAGDDALYGAVAACEAQRRQPAATPSSAMPR